MRLCADQPDAREGLRDGSLTLSAAAELQWAFARQRRRGSISGTAAIAPDGVGGGVGGTERSGGRLRAGRTVALRRAGAAAAGAGCGGIGGNWSRRPPARAPGRSARCWPTWTRSWRRRPTGCARSATAARAEGDHRRGVPAGAGAAPGAALARGPRMTMGHLVGPPGQGGARPPRPEPAAAPSAQRQSARGREGKRPANSDAGAGAREAASRRRRPTQDAATTPLPTPESHALRRRTGATASPTEGPRRSPPAPLPHRTRALPADDRPPRRSPSRYFGAKPTWGRPSPPPARAGQLPA